MATSARYGDLSSDSYEPRMPSHQNFDSLQDLLEQAGYKETRIFTPASIHNIKAHNTPPRDASVHVQGRVSSGRYTDAQDASTSSSNWFSSLWRGKEVSKAEVNERRSRQKVLNRKQSEPALSKNGRKAVQRSWMGMWATLSPMTEPEDSQEIESTQLSSTETSVETILDTPTYDVLQDSQVSISSKERPPLRHAPSTGELWRGSLRHHRSLPKIRPKESAIRRMESFDGAAVVAGVGVAPAKSVSTELVLIAKPQRRKSLRQAFTELANDEIQQKKVQEIKLQSKISISAKGDELIWADSVGTLTDLQDQDRDNQGADRTEEVSAPPIKPATALFSTAAIPLLSRQEAVAMRNVDCLDFAGRTHSSNIDDHPKRRSLRKMRSVDALELALAKMEKRKESARTVSATRHDTIPESFSAESLTNEDLASGATVTTVVDSLEVQPAGLTVEEEEEEEEGEEGEAIDPIHRSTTPRLLLTSPTGLRSPQELHLEGREYEPRSYSPESISIDQIVADNLNSWTANHSIARHDIHRGRVADGYSKQSDLTQFTNLPKRSSSRRRSRSIRTREVTQDCSDLSIPPTGKEAKKRNSKSCHNLRGARSEANKSQAGDTAPMSGSEQVRALKKEMMERNKVVSKRKSAGTITAIPCSPLENDGDDPFSDLNALALAAVAQERLPSDASRPSSVPFEAAKLRRPLSSCQTQVQAQPLPQARNPMHGGKIELIKKKSGVGIACLVEKDSHNKHMSRNNENEAPDLLLDSPTAQIVKKRSSRTTLR